MPIQERKKVTLVCQDTENRLVVVMAYVKNLNVLREVFRLVAGNRLTINFAMSHFPLIEEASPGIPRNFKLEWLHVLAREHHMFHRNKTVDEYVAWYEDQDFDAEYRSIKPFTVTRPRYKGKHHVSSASSSQALSSSGSDLPASNDREG